MFKGWFIAVVVVVWTVIILYVLKHWIKGHK